MNDLILYVTLSFVFGVILYAFKHLDIGQALNIAILALTAAALVWTTVDAKQSALEAQQADLRPVIFRDGIIPSWSEFKSTIKGKPMDVTFFVANNLATNISGYVVSDGKKYPFSFAVSKVGEKEGSYIATVHKDSSVTWTLPGKPIVGMVYPDRFSNSTEAEGFHVFYSDIGGINYKTFEGSNLQTISEKISK